LGKPVERIWAEWAGAKKELDSGTEAVREVSFGVGEEKKFYEIQTSYLSGIMSEHPNLLIILRDTTERKRAEAALRESEARYRTLFDNANDALYLHDRTGRLLDVNNVACERIGYSREELLKMSLKDINSPEAAALIPQHMQETHERGQSIFESQEIKRDGSSFPVEVSVRPLSYKGDSVMLGISRDITERKHLEENLRQYSEHLEDLVEAKTADLTASARKYQLLVDNMADAIFTIDLKGNLTFLSPQTGEMTGYSLQQLHSMNIKDLIAPEDLPEVLRRLEERRGGASGLLPMQFGLVKADGTRLPIEVHTSLLYEGNMPVGVQGIARDITERKRMEERLATAKRLAAIGETTAMVGHDLRNPLQAISGALYLANKLVASKKVEDRREAMELLNTIDEQITYMDKIISDLQDYARPISIEASETSLADLIRDTAGNARVPESVNVSLVLPNDVSNVILDRTLFRRVLTNLIVNAVQSMPQGGKLTITAYKEGESLTVIVQDTGVGIAQENLAKIFSPFFTTKAKGQGLGLSVCKRLAEAQDGTITVKSELGKGSAFTFTIPTKPHR
jgi:PAS domain S-box-containing protein